MLPLRSLAESHLSGSDPRAVLGDFARALERFLTQVLPILSAAQADPELRDLLAAYMTREDLALIARSRSSASTSEGGRPPGSRARTSTRTPCADAGRHVSGAQHVPAHGVNNVTLPAIDDAVDALVTMLAV